MRKQILSCCALAVSVTAAAANYGLMSFETANGAHRTIGVQNLVMNFDNGQLLASNGTENLAIDLDELTAFYFTDGTGVGNVEFASDSDYEVYDLSGVYLGHFDSFSSLKAGLASGTYVVKSESGTTKLYLK